MLEGIGPGSSVKLLQERLKSTRAPWYGTRAQCWQRLLEWEARRKQKEAEGLHRELLREELRMRAEAGIVAEPTQMPNVPEPTQQERDEHEANQYYPPKSWCEHCQMGRGTDKRHELLDACEGSKIPVIGMDLAFINGVHSGRAGEDQEEPDRGRDRAKG